MKINLLPFQQDLYAFCKLRIYVYSEFLSVRWSDSRKCVLHVVLIDAMFEKEAVLLPLALFTDPVARALTSRKTRKTA